MADINIKAKIQVDTGDSAKKVEGVQNAVKNTGAGVKDAGAQFGKLKGELGALSPALGSASQGVGALTQAFNILKANPIIGVFALIAGLVVALFQRFKQMEGVSDSLGKAFGVLSGIFDTFINAILTPLIDGFTWLIENITGGLVNVLSALGVTTQETAKRFGEITEALDNLEDAQRNSAIATAEANRKLQEAREIAADANVPIKQRIAALKEAAKIEKEESDKVVAINQTKARLLLESMAIELGARADVIKSIREGSIESLKAARLELQNMKNIDKEKLSQIDAMIIAAEDAAAQSAKVAKKTQSQITSIEKEDSDKRVAEAKTESARKLKILEDEIAERKRLEENYTKALSNAFQLELQAAANVTKAQKEKKDQEKKDQDDANAYLESQFQEEERLNGIVLENKNKEVVASNKLAAVDKANSELKKQEQATQMDMAAQSLDALAGMVDKNSVAGKGIAVAQAIMNTYQGASKAIAQGGFFGPVLAAITVAAGLINVKKIISTKVPSMKGGGEVSGGSASLPSASSPIQPQMQGTQLNDASIRGIGNAAAGGVNRAFVLDRDINDSAERQSRLQRASRLG
jgi:chemotaxis protein histidine kinase CheA